MPPDTAAPSAAPENAVPGNPTGATGTGAEGNPPAATAGNTAPEADNAETTAPPAKPAPTTKKIREPKPTPVTPTDPTAEAESYIYGRGVSQDCDRGLRLLKPAAAHSVKAMIALGTLYSSGTCAPRDLPTAYRYFAMALHQQPDNQPVQNDLQDIWAKMTQPERQLAIKLSQ
jgi:TPR repeat protein